LLRASNTTALVAGSSFALLPIVNPIAATLDVFFIAFPQQLLLTSRLVIHSIFTRSVTLEPSVFSSVMLRFASLENARLHLRHPPRYFYLFSVTCPPLFVPSPLLRVITSVRLRSFSQLEQRSRIFPISLFISATSPLRLLFFFLPPFLPYFPRVLRVAFFLRSSLITANVRLRLGHVRTLFTPFNFSAVTWDFLRASACAPQFTPVILRKVLAKLRYSQPRCSLYFQSDCLRVAIAVFSPNRGIQI